MSEKIVYEKHPVSAERKTYLRQKGYKILDARFAPEDYKHPDPVKEVKAGNGGNGKTAAEKKAAAEAEAKEKLQTALTAKGIEFSPEASAADLQKLLDEAA
ncbi:hypothetical protein [Pseudomonas sp. NMI1173_11]|uniref:hypothetical protein n=1 Tax=Pseudomonas sp. NMI1173_11 TaxID=2903145 RepID=UPI001E4953D0|nr:hypothetical protein [Pseudomonas sp. NMI1173_11]MCE1000014.1 hypothetical protein [Pseudomonas sp. NMI1173_11]